MNKVILANWKMHYGPLKAGAWIRAFRRERLPKEVAIGVAVPHVSLAAARASLGRASVPMLGAQDAFWTNEGAFTGETSPEMLKEFTVEFCIVGHSERRVHLGETDAMVAKKASALQAAGIRPVICVGETLADRKKKQTNAVVKKQLTLAIEELKAEGTIPIVAYEPVWAIGTGKTATPQEIQQVHTVIRELLRKRFLDKADQIPLLYGGSVDSNNVGDYLSTTNVDGALVGGASLDPRSFGLLCRSAIRG
jgi:triosephosphate isomerase (TIM)